MRRIPDEIGHLTFLKELSVYDTKIKALPPSFARLCDLRYLALRNSQLRQIPGEARQRFFCGAFSHRPFGLRVGKAHSLLSALSLRFSLPGRCARSGSC